MADAPDSARSDEPPAEGWRCPACLASIAAGVERCEHCRSAVVLAERFVVTEPLASEGSARTLAGRDRHDQTPVVIKTLSISGMSNWKQLELFQRGIAVLRGLEHRGIPRHLADGELSRGGETIYFWVQERIEGGNLAERLEKGQRWTEARARALADGLLEILEHLQQYSPPIVHRDIKPSNIIEVEEGHWVLIDFDLVKDTLDPEGMSTVALGTAGYAPMEQLMGRAGLASDLYGLGATLVALLSRKSPADLLGVDGRVDFEGYLRVSPSFAAFLSRLLEPQADRRPADARAARALLAESPPDTPGFRSPALASAPIPAHASASQLLALPEPAEAVRDARERLLAVLQQRVEQAVAPAGASTALVLDEPDDVVESARSLEAVEPAGRPLVRIGVPLLEKHPPPGWLMPLRLLLVAGVGIGAPASGAVLAVVLATAWIVSGFIVRYPVQLAPGRALFKGGLSNTDTAGRYWLRRRWVDVAHSIPLDVLRIAWNPAPTRLDGAAHDMWLEVAMVIWVRPREDEVGQFFSLLNYRAWTEHPTRCAAALREEVMSEIVEAIATSRIIEREGARKISLTEAVMPAIDEGIKSLGLTRVALHEHYVRLIPRTEDLTSEDKVVVDQRPPPEGSESPRLGHR